MTHLSARRILDLPAIGPCDSISLPTLLRALIRVSGAIIARRSDAFPIHRRIILETIREVGVLQEFFEDVAERGTALPASATVGLSELYIALHKIQNLISDCARRGARLWILARSDRVSSEFRLLIRSISVALDVLPLDAIDAAPEMKELIFLLSAQARKVGVEVDPADDSAARTVRFVLDQFKSGAAPDPADLSRVLKRLDVSTWSECDEEVSFLEEEMFSCLQEESNEVAIFGTLMSFMVYCRVVLFITIDGEGVGRDERARRAFDTSSLNPQTLVCPISLEIMKDPVTISTGHTYDRVAIKKWIKSGSCTCPITGEKLTNVDFVPNSSLRRVIEQFYSNKGVEISESNTKHTWNIEKTATPFSSAAAGATKMAVAFLIEKLAKGGEEEEKRKAVYEIRKLSKFNLFNRACLVEADAVPWLLYLLSSSSSSDASTQLNIVSALLNLSKHPNGRKAVFEAGGVDLIIDIMRVGLKVEAQNNAAAILFYLSSADEYRKEIGEIRRAIPALLELLQEGSYRGKKNAITCLFGLLQYPGNHRKIVAAGAIPVLTNLLSSDHVDLANDSVQVLEKIAERDEGTDAIIGSAGIAKIAEILSSTSSRSGKEHCVSLLLHLCSNGGDKVVSVIEKIPPLISSLYSIVTEGSPQAGRKARLILNRIHRRSTIS
ncbi:U-box domain-containing protein 19-like [Ananas comosus]|uniref:RING-type E3 ubiquitin transferase n=1 Tax=Ananas comosus TaxID=4615 RepID=A0A199ULR8_ANACO|nr:U-box domain-containing protein 19-like [Ananas comosus]OAY65832.1 U-box domain-containing protein 19 [Ananas comosus]